MITYLNKMRSRGAATQAVSNFYAFSLFLNKIEIYFLELFTLKLDFSFKFHYCKFRCIKESQQPCLVNQSKWKNSLGEIMLMAYNFCATETFHGSVFFRTKI